MSLAPECQRADDAVRAARDATKEALRLCGLAGYGSCVLPPVEEALASLEYVLADILEDGRSS